MTQATIELTKYPNSSVIPMLNSAEDLHNYKFNISQYGVLPDKVIINLINTILNITTDNVQYVKLTIPHSIEVENTIQYPIEMFVRSNSDTDWVHIFDFPAMQFVNNSNVVVMDMPTIVSNTSANKTNIDKAIRHKIKADVDIESDTVLPIGDNHYYVFAHSDKEIQHKYPNGIESTINDYFITTRTLYVFNVISDRDKYGITLIKKQELVVGNNLEMGLVYDTELDKIEILPIVDAINDRDEIQNIDKTTLNKSLQDLKQLPITDSNEHDSFIIRKADPKIFVIQDNKR